MNEKAKSSLTKQVMDFSKRDSVSFLIFSVNTRVYAIDIALIQEIAQNVKIHSLPFVPDFIEGLINSAGIAYTAVNPILAFPGEDENENAVIENQNFLIFKRDDDNFCIHISSIEIFYEILAEDIEDSIDGDNLVYKNRRIPLFNPDDVEKILLESLRN